MDAMKNKVSNLVSKEDTPHGMNHDPDRRRCCACESCAGRV